LLHATAFYYSLIADGKRPEKDGLTTRVLSDAEYQHLYRKKVLDIDLPVSKP
jgi:hypothetical protein